MTREVGWDHDEEHSAGQRQHREQIRIYAYECPDKEEGKCLGRLDPGKETYGPVLRHKGYADTRVEAAEVGRHGGDAEVWSGDIGAGSAIFDLRYAFVWC